MRIIGLDIHRAFAGAVAWEDGGLRRLGRVDMRRDLLDAFAAKLSLDDVVVIEATGNASSAAAVVAPHVKKVVIATPSRCASSPMPRSRRTRSMPAFWRSSMPAASYRKSGFRMSRRRLCVDR